MDEAIFAARGAADPATSFGTVHIIQPVSHHTHTAVLLHGRGSSGEEFAEELIASVLSNQRTLMQALPGWRWVFPTSRDLWSTAFQENIPAWFEAHSLTDVTERQDLQTEGIKDSVGHLSSILEEEVERLGGHGENLVLGGISQGAAIGIWALLCAAKSVKRFGAFFGASTWLPFADNIERLLCRGHASARSESDRVADAFVESMMINLKNSPAGSSGPASLTSTPVFLGHGVDDAYVDITLGRQARNVLARIGLKVEWKEYSGAEQEGHWLKVPEEVDDIAHFLLLLIPR